MWEYNHNNVFTVYRIYYRGIVIDPKIFPPVAPRVVDVPTKKTDPAPAVEASGAGGSAISLPIADLAINREKVKSAKLTDEERRAILKEMSGLGVPVNIHQEKCFVFSFLSIMYANRDG